MALILGIFCGAIFGAAATGWYYARVSAPPTGPIVLVSIDTLRADHLPAYGYKKVQTPAIDALAADGTVFERAYAHSPQTFPSHVAILSGRLPFENGVRDNVGFTLPPDVKMLPSLLGSRGWTTAGVVSSFVLRKELGLDRGFDFFDSQMPPAAPDLPMGQVQRPGLDSFEVAREWMDGQSSPRFFLFFHIYEPHTPYRPPREFAHYEPYDGEIAASDAIVGRLTAYLARRGWYNEATIILLSDHGEGLGDHGEQEHGLFLYDETIRVPLIVKMSGQEGAGRRLSTPAQHIDLVPTILDWLGAPEPSGLRGRSLRRLLDRGRDDLPGQSFYAESFYARYHFGWSELYALTDDRYRYIRAPRPELYDLEQDPAERLNLAADRPQPAQAMRIALDGLLSGAAIHTPGAVSREDLARLQALGYVGSNAAVPPETSGDSLPDPKDKVVVLEAFRRAIELGTRREYDESIRILADIVGREPRMKDAWLQLAVEQVRSGRLEDGLKSFRTLVELDPADPSSLISVAGVLQTLGRLDEALKNAEAALAMTREDDVRTRVTAAEALVKITLARKDREAARRYAVMAAQADPGFPLPAWVEAQVLYQDGKYAEALPLFQDTADALQGRGMYIPELFYYMGDTLDRLGRDAEAEAAFKSQLRMSPEHARAHGGLAMLYRAQRRDAEVEQTIDALLRAVPTPDGYNLAVRLWTIFGEKERAEAVRAEARKLAARRRAGSPMAADGKTTK